MSAERSIGFMPSSPDSFANKEREHRDAQRQSGSKIIDAPLPRILSEVTLSQQGSFKRVQQFMEGWHPALGTLHHGWSGHETIVEKDIITPVRRFNVVEVSTSIEQKGPGNIAAGGK